MQEVFEEEIMPSAFAAPKPEIEIVEEVAPAVVEQPEEQKPEPEMQVIVLNVHCAVEEPFIGTELFDSMQHNGLIYGEM
ncbi:cell division protein ZipA, partial [Vibrio parahaemolyticus]|nr:cell division protein ZipA [Vibrio parahaemolyticus]